MLYTRQNETIRNTSLILDGQRFIECAFVDCQLIVEGRMDFDFQDCTFNKCTWTFDDAAQRTITALATLASKTGPEGRALINAVFQSILNLDLRDLPEGDRVSISATIEGRSELKATLAS